MIMRLINNFRNWIEDMILLAFYKMSKDTRVIVILVFFFLFSFASLYFFVSSIYRIGRRDGRELQIEHIRQLELQGRNDSINFSTPLKQQEYEQGQREQQ